MNKFYVYTLKDENPDERSCIYVDEELIDKFATHEYRPEDMEFSGVMVEADSPTHAHEVYNTFAGDIISVDEPASTVKKRKAYEKRPEHQLKELQKHLADAEQAAMRLAIQALARQISSQCLKINNDMSMMARMVRKTTAANPDIPAEALYESIKNKYLNEITKLEYEEPGYDSPF